MVAIIIITVSSTLHLTMVAIIIITVSSTVSTCVQ